MPRQHARPTGEVTVPTYRDLDPVVTVSGIADYFGVSKPLANKWTMTSDDFPEPLARLPTGAIYVTADVIEWGRRHERQRGGGPRARGDNRPPSIARKR